MSRNSGNTSTDLDKIVIACILKYDLHFHISLIGPFKNQLQKTPNSDQKRPLSDTAWRIISYLCKAHLGAEKVSLSDIFLSLEISKGTAISCLTNLEDWGLIKKSPAPNDKRRLIIELSDEYIAPITDFVDYWKARYNTESVPFDVPIRDRQNLGPDSQSEHLIASLKKIIRSAEILESQALGKVTPNGYVQLATDIKAIATELATNHSDT